MDRQREIYREQVEGKPAKVVEKIVDGKLEKVYGSVCLLDQAFIKNPDQTIRDLVSSKIAELGENIVVRRFTRYAVGEDVGADQGAPAEGATGPWIQPAWFEHSTAVDHSCCAGPVPAL